MDEIIKEIERRIKNLENITFRMIGCDTCQHNDKPWYSKECDPCCRAHSSWTPARELDVKVKYFDSDYPRLERIEGEKSDWIDLRSRERIELREGHGYLIPLGVAMKLPKGYEAIVAPRSSAFKHWGIIQTNSIGVIDESYCGDNDEWMMSVYATRNAIIEKYDRVCQFRIIRHQPEINIKEVKNLNGKDRGGFGSTGK